MMSAAAERRLRIFIRSWQETIWAAMQKTGKGYRKHSLKHSGWGNDRTTDKLDHAGESKLQRKARHGELGVL